MDTIYNFDANGVFTGASDRPIDPVRGEPAAVNTTVATLMPVPVFDAESHRVRWVSGSWTLEEMPEPEPEPVREPQYPRFYGNQKLDLFTRAEQLAVVTATMTDPVVKLMYDRLLGAAYWTYEDPETEQGLSLLIDKGLLTPDRKAEIVALMKEG